MSLQRFCALAVVLTTLIAPSGLEARRSQRRAAVPPKPAASTFDDRNLADWRLQPFSDYASHGVLLRESSGLWGWTLRSAKAFGSQAAQPHPAKDLLRLRVELRVEGESVPRFAAAAALSFTSFPRWSEESGVDGPLKVEAVTAFAATDVVVAALNVRNAGPKALRLRPCLRLQREGRMARLRLEPDAREPWLGLVLDRSAAVGRPLVESVHVRLGGQAGQFNLAEGAQLKALSPGAAVEWAGNRDLDLELTWPAPQLLAPGQSLRVPLLLAWGDTADAAKLRAAAAKAWHQDALPVGKAWRTAKLRWAATKSRLPVPPVPARARLLGRAALDLLLSEYAPRANLNARQFSAAKGWRDAFFSVDSPLACLAWAELEPAWAEEALLGLSSFSAAAPAPLPPHTGEEKLAWDAAGLPLHALAAWELYHRDPQPLRAAKFLATFGERLRNECAWWPEARDGDGNGLYAFAQDEEKPPYLRRRSAVLPPLFDTPQDPSRTAQPSLQSWSVALTSLVAWQMQAASALAQAAGAQDEAERYLLLSQKSVHALLEQGWDEAAGEYKEGLDGMWPFLLGLDTNSTHAARWIEQKILPRLSVGERPWMEEGVETPWRYYFLAKTLASYGYWEQERETTKRFLDEMEKKQFFSYEYGPNAKLNQGGAVATAAVVLELILDRQEQDVFLTPATRGFEAPFIQFRTLDGKFYMKRIRLPEKAARYADILVETQKNNRILDENSFIFSSKSNLAIQIQSEWPLDISDLTRNGAPIFRDAHRVEFLVPAGHRMKVAFKRSEEPTEGP